VAVDERGALRGGLAVDGWDDRARPQRADERAELRIAGFVIIIIIVNPSSDIVIAVTSARS